jgi:hypothetical protein
MPSNPERSTRGGDVSGTCKTDNEWGVGSATTVADASYEPGYELDTTMEAGYVSMADIKAGYCSYGVGAGMARPKGIIGGR